MTIFDRKKKKSEQRTPQAKKNEEWTPYGQKKTNRPRQIKMRRNDE